MNKNCLCVLVSDPSGSEVQPLGGLVVVRGTAVRDAPGPVPVPRPRRGGAVPVHQDRQPRLPPLARPGRQGHPHQGRPCWPRQGAPFSLKQI